MGLRKVKRVCAAFLAVYSQDHKPLIFVFDEYFLECWHFGTARRAPACPEVYHHRVALEISKLDFLAIEIYQAEIRGWKARARSRDAAVCRYLAFRAYCDPYQAQT